MSGALPSVFREGVVAPVVARQIDAGERDPALIASNTACIVLGNRGCRVFPPDLRAPLGVRVAWDQLVGYVDAQFRQRGIRPGDVRAPADGVAWAVISTAPGSLDLEGYPWERPVIHEQGWPAPGTCWAAGAGDSDATLTRGFVRCALALAGADASLASDDSKVGRRLRRDARELILAADFNDRRVTSYSATRAGGRDPGTNGAADTGVTYVMGERGRGLVWDAFHYDDLARLGCGLPAKRGVGLDGARLGSGRGRMVLYLPAVNLVALRSSSPELTTDGMAWSSGVSTAQAPPAIDRLGIDMSGVELE